jgi:hypothetical protein
LSEWCRQVLLDAAAGPAQAPEAEVILSEILALRKIVINLLYGEKAGEPLSEERMRELIEAADSEKLRKAAERLRTKLSKLANTTPSRSKGNVLVCTASRNDPYHRYCRKGDGETWFPF